MVAWNTAAWFVQDLTFISVQTFHCACICACLTLKLSFAHLLICHVHLRTQQISIWHPLYLRSASLSLEYKSRSTQFLLKHQQALNECIISIILKWSGHLIFLSTKGLRMNALSFPWTDVTPFVIHVFAAEVPYLSLDNFFRTRITYMLKLCADVCVFHLLVLGCYFLKLEYGQKTLIEPYFLSCFSSLSVLADSKAEMKCTYRW